MKLVDDSAKILAQALFGARELPQTENVGIQWTGLSAHFAAFSGCSRGQRLYFCLRFTATPPASVMNYKATSKNYRPLHSWRI